MTGLALDQVNAPIPHLYGWCVISLASLMLVSWCVHKILLCAPTVGDYNDVTSDTVDR